MGSTDKKKTGNPQVENGYVRIATELFEQLYQIPLNGSQIRIVLFIIRNTYGFNRKTWKMSAGYIARGTGICTRVVQREIKKLENCNILKVSHAGIGKIGSIGINKKYSEWMIKPTTKMSQCTNGRNAYDQYDVGTYDQYDVGTYDQLVTQHNTDKHNTDNIRQEEEKELSLRSLPSDWKTLIPEAEISEEYQKLKLPNGTYLDPREVDWERLRE